MLLAVVPVALTRLMATYSGLREAIGIVISVSFSVMTTTSPELPAYKPMHWAGTLSVESLGVTDVMSRAIPVFSYENKAFSFPLG